MNAYGFDGLCCPILDARRGQVYCAAYDMRGGMPVQFLAPDARMLTDFAAMLPADRRLMFVGDGVAVVEWPQMADLETTPALDVQMSRGEGEEARLIEIENYGVKGFDPGALTEWEARS